MTVRVRYAPSPTGHLHVGSLRTALYNWLFACHNKGTFLLRIEDTDQERSLPAYTQAILEGLAWAGIDADEPPVVQSERMQEHLRVAQQLLSEGQAYKCYCTQDELSERLGKASKEHGYTQYDRYCLDRTPQDPQAPYVIRFMVPLALENVTFDDLIRGPISIDVEQLDDFIIVRSDGMPTYNFVVVLDDAGMGITHVLRGEDHISNTPKQILLYQACGYEVPEFAHFSLILGPDGHRLSKRHGATSVDAFKKEGYLPHALCTYLARLGWSYGDQELFTIDELIEHFSLEGMNKAGATFDQDKLAWVNSVYIKELSAVELLARIEQDVEPQVRQLLSNWSTATLEVAVDIYKERVKTLQELVSDLQALHDRPTSFEAGDDDCQSIEILKQVYEALDGLSDLSQEGITHCLKELGSKAGMPIKQIFQPVRRALTGRTSSPGVARLIVLLSLDETKERIEYYMKHLKRSMKHCQ